MLYPIPQFSQKSPKRYYPNPITTIILVFLTFLPPPTLSQAAPPPAFLESPCPRLFAYEPLKEADRWFGVVTLISESDLSGVWLRLIFDRPSLQLGNWFGEVVTQDNKEYLVKNRNHEIKASMPYALRFFIKFNPSEPIPQLIAFRLNAKTVCPEGGLTTPPTGPVAVLQTSGELATPPTVAPPVRVPVTESLARPGGAWFPQEERPSSNEDNDFFQGDFSLFGSRPSKPLLPTPNQNIECGTVVTMHDRRKRDAIRSNNRYNPSYDDRFDWARIMQRILQAMNTGQYWANPWEPPTPFVAYPRPDFEQQQVAHSGNIHPTPLISHGQATKEGEFPWHAALYYAKGIDLAYICGASLVSQRHVITVAHCATKKSSANALNPENLVVYLGKHYLRRWSNPGIQDSHVSKIIIHPQYEAPKYVHDIAVIELSKPVEFTDYVRPICLWTEDNNIDNIVNKLGTVVGWGIDERGHITEQLTQAKMPVVRKETCIYSFPDFFSRYTTDKSFCAGFRNGTSVCNGDSGGGMVFPKGVPGTRQIWHLRGLVSISVALQNQFTCDSSHYVVFTDVAKYLDWIKAAMI